jgi:hypothetical protein
MVLEEGAIEVRKVRQQSQIRPDGRPLKLWQHVQQAFNPETSVTLRDPVVLGALLTAH